MNYDYYIGIDVGYSGGIAVIDAESKAIEVYKTPREVLDFINRLEQLKQKSSNGRVFCVVEKAMSRFGDSAHSAQTFGYIIGLTHAALEVAKTPYEECTPQKWMKHFNMKKDNKGGETNTSWKNRLKALAQELFPDVKCTLWNADALLIAEYCKRIHK